MMPIRHKPAHMAAEVYSTLGERGQGSTTLQRGERKSMGRSPEGDNPARWIPA